MSFIVSCVLSLSIAGEARVPAPVSSAVSSAEAPGQGPGKASARERLRELERDLRAAFPDKRRRAVKKLAALGTEKAWECVLGALRDREPEVADEAQIRLGELREPRFLRRLYGADGLAARGEWVRLRVAEAFGRMPGPIEGRRLARALDPGQVAVARALLWSLERLAARDALAGEREAIARRVEVCLARRHPPALRAAALSALARVHPPSAEPLLEEALADAHAAVRRAALAARHRALGAGALGAAQSLAEDGDAHVREHAIEVLADIGGREALASLVLRLEREPRSRLRWRVVGALQELSGMKYRLDPRPWRRFLAELPPDWEAPPPAPAGAREAGAVARAGARLEAERTSVGLAGLPVLSDRVCILVDFSGSLWQERADGRTRKDLLDGEMRRLLESLPPETEFNLVPYTGEPFPWRDAIAPARPREVKAAALFFERCKHTGRGNFFDAALLALRDPRVDTILAITDGAPTGGHRWNLELMVDLLVEESRYAGVAFDSILIDASPRLQKSWRRLAETTGGRSIAVQFEEDPEGEREGGRGGQSGGR